MTKTPVSRIASAYIAAQESPATVKTAHWGPAMFSESGWHLAMFGEDENGGADHEDNGEYFVLTAKVPSEHNFIGENGKARKDAISFLKSLSAYALGCVSFIENHKPAQKNPFSHLDSGGAPKRYNLPSNTRNLDDYGIDSDVETPYVFRAKNKHGEIVIREGYILPRMVIIETYAGQTWGVFSARDTHEAQAWVDKAFDDADAAGLPFKTVVNEIGFKWQPSDFPKYAALAEPKTASLNDVGQIILDQMGGIRRLSMMIGMKSYYNLTGGKQGVGFVFPNRERSKGNNVEIELMGDDTYTVHFFNRAGMTKKLIKTVSDVYADSLVAVFERQTGWFLRL